MRLRKTLRGGAWNDSPRYCRSASRSRNEPGSTYNDLGFRVVCNKESPPSRKTLRGGAWNDSPRYCRSATRGHSEPGITIINVGFRVVCNKEEP